MKICNLLTENGDVFIAIVRLQSSVGEDKAKSLCHKSSHIKILILFKENELKMNRYNIYVIMKMVMFNGKIKQ